MLNYLIALFFMVLPLQAIAEDDAVFEQEKVATSKEDRYVHLFFDVKFKNDYITPRGLLVTDTGLATQVLLNFSIDLYRNPKCFINSFSVFAGIWNDMWSDQHHPTAGNWVECDWFAGFFLTTKNHFKFSVQYIEFLSPPGNFSPEQNIEFLLAYDDTHSGLPIVLNPYVKLFWAVAGDSTVVVGQRGGTYDVEIGMVPTWSLKKQGIPLLFSMPTWVTVGPASFWNGGDFVLKNSNKNAGVFSTGLIAHLDLEFIPKKRGNWYFEAGYQYYYLINENLLEAQMFTLGLESRKDAQRNVNVYFLGFGFLY
ncbi:MAG: hypothetical protein LW832_05240 [Parachlamydia sp.]|nr:hypothetical protein [Parachlamydia sp.]